MKKLPYVTVAVIENIENMPKHGKYRAIYEVLNKVDGYTDLNCNHVKFDPVVEFELIATRNNTRHVGMVTPNGLVLLAIYRMLGDMKLGQYKLDENEPLEALSIRTIVRFIRKDDTPIEELAAPDSATDAPMSDIHGETPVPKESFGHFVSIKGKLPNVGQMAELMGALVKTGHYKMADGDKVVDVAVRHNDTFHIYCGARSKRTFYLVRSAGLVELQLTEDKSEVHAIDLIKKPEGKRPMKTMVWEAADKTNNGKQAPKPGISESIRGMHMDSSAPQRVAYVLVSEKHPDEGPTDPTILRKFAKRLELDTVWFRKDGSQASFAKRETFQLMSRNGQYVIGRVALFSSWGFMKLSEGGSRLVECDFKVAGSTPCEMIKRVANDETAPVPETAVDPEVPVKPTELTNLIDQLINQSIELFPQFGPKRTYLVDVTTPSIGLGKFANMRNIEYEPLLNAEKVKVTVDLNTVILTLAESKKLAQVIEELQVRQ